MGDQQQKIEALRAAMTSIQERDPNEPVPDFLVVDTSVSIEPEGAESEGAEPDGVVPEGAAPGAAGSPGSLPAETAPAGSDSAGPDTIHPDVPGPALEAPDLPTDAAPSGLGYVADGEGSDDGPVPEDEAETETSSGSMAELSPEEQYDKARAVVLRKLTGSPKSRHQLAVALAEKEFTPGTITRVLDRMEEVHLINDTEFARTWVKGRHELKNLGKSALRRELREKGISEPVAEDALDQISPEDEGEAARQLVQRKLAGKTVPTGPSPEERAERDKVTRRLVSMLARRGHAPGSAFQIVREVIEDHSNA